MRQLSYYTVFIIGYGVLFVMLYDTLVLGGPFPVDTPFFFIITTLMMAFGAIWVLGMIVKYCVALRYPASMHTLKTTARLLHHGPFEPRVSVIIPAYNEAVGIVSTLKTLVNSTYRNMEILIIDDGSTDATGWIVQQFIAHYQFTMQGQGRFLVYHRKPNGGKGSALNYGIQHAQGEILCTFDADCIVDTHCVERFVSYFIDPMVMACSGNIKIGNKTTAIGLIQHLEYLLAFHMKKAETVFGTVFVIGGAASAFRREVFTRLGGYNTSMLTEDMELSFRIQQAGMKILYTDDALVYTEGPTTLQGLIKQRIRWKRGCLETLLLYRSIYFSKRTPNRLFFSFIAPGTFLQYGEFVFSFFGMFLILWYCLLSFNFEPLLAVAFLTAGIYTLLFWSDPHERKLSSFLLVPLTWYLFCVINAVEVFSLLKAIWTLVFKQKVTWQTWQRQGVISQ